MSVKDVGYNRLVKDAARSGTGYLIAALSVAGITLVGARWLHLNPTTLALAFLLGVLGISASWGLRQAVFMSVIATLAFNHFFLPPIGTFTISDPQNWIALFAFLVTAVTASEMSERARRGARSAVERRQELERLYTFSQLLLSSDNQPGPVVEPDSPLHRGVIQHPVRGDLAVQPQRRLSLWPHHRRIGIARSPIDLLARRTAVRRCPSTGLYAAPHGHARGGLHGGLRLGAFAANPGGHRQPG